MCLSLVPWSRVPCQAPREVADRSYGSSLYPVLCCSGDKFASHPVSLPSPLQSFGFNLLARSNYHWQLGFSRAERLLMEGIDEDGGCRMKCFRVMRQMKEDVWCKGNKPVLSSYHLQVGTAITVMGEARAERLPSCQQQVNSVFIAGTSSRLETYSRT